MLSREKFKVPLTFSSSLESSSASFSLASSDTFGAPSKATITTLMLSRLPCYDTITLFKTSLTFTAKQNAVDSN